MPFIIVFLVLKSFQVPSSAFNGADLNAFRSSGFASLDAGAEKWKVLILKAFHFLCFGVLYSQGISTFIFLLSSIDKLNK